MHMILSRPVHLTVTDFSQKKTVEKIKNTFYAQLLFFKNRATYEKNVEKFCKAGEATDDKITRRMRFACWKTKPTNTQSE